MTVSTEVAQNLVTGSVVGICGFGSALVTAVIGAAVEAMSPGWTDRSAGRMRAGFSILARLIVRFVRTLRVAPARVRRLAKGVAVTYLHRYPHDVESGRHFEGVARRTFRAGRHRAVTS